MRPQRLFWLHYDTLGGYVGRGDSPFKTIYDLKKAKGVRISVNPAIPSMGYIFKETLPAFLGMSQAEANEHFLWVPCVAFAERFIPEVTGICMNCQESD